MIVWMRVGGVGLTVVVTGALVAIATVLLVPGILTAGTLGYTWTYAFGGTFGVGAGTVVFFFGSFIGASIAFVLGRSMCFSKLKPADADTFRGRALVAFEEHPIKLVKPPTHTFSRSHVPLTLTLTTRSSASSASSRSCRSTCSTTTSAPRAASSTGTSPPPTSASRPSPSRAHQGRTQCTTYTVHLFLVHC